MKDFVKDFAFGVLLGLLFAGVFLIGWELG